MGSRYDCDGALGRCLLDAGHIKPCFAPGPGQIPAGMPAAGGYFAWCPNCHQYWDHVAHTSRSLLCSYECEQQVARVRHTLQLLSRVAVFMWMEANACGDSFERPMWLATAIRRGMLKLDWGRP